MRARVKLSPKAGLHGRPGALLVDLAGRNPGSRIFLMKRGKKAEAASILNLLALGAAKGETVEVCVEGKNGKKIMAAVRKILEGKKA